MILFNRAKLIQDVRVKIIEEFRVFLLESGCKPRDGITQTSSTKEDLSFYYGYFFQMGLGLGLISIYVHSLSPKYQTLFLNI